MALILFYSSTPYAETAAPLDKKGQNSAESILDMDTPWNQALTSGLQVYIHILER